MSVMFKCVHCSVQEMWTDEMIFERKLPEHCGKRMLIEHFDGSYLDALVRTKGVVAKRIVDEIEQLRAIGVGIV